MNYTEIRRTLLLSAQRALLGMIYPEIRAIAVGFEETNKLIVYCYLDREPNDDDHENLSDVTGEIMADIDFLEVDEKCIYATEPISNLNSLEAWVYMRKEE